MGNQTTGLKTFLGGFLGLIILASLLIFSPDIRLWLSRSAIVPIAE